MNVENILKVADAIEAACAPEANPEIGFNMFDYYTKGFKDHTGHDCDTAACIAGWAQTICLEPSEEKSLPYCDGARAFGLDDQMASDLFVPTYGEGLYKIEALHAVAVLRHLAKTGRVNWTVVAPQTGEDAS